MRGQQHSQRGGLPVLVLALALVLVLLGHAAGEGVELSSSAILFYAGDVQPASDGGMSQCELLVRRAAAHGGRRVQIIATHYWLDAADAKQAPHVCYPDNWAKTDLRVDSYCFKQRWDSACERFTAAAVDAFTQGLARCFSVAASLFDEVLATPHLDPGLGDTSLRPTWRNNLRFDPLWKDPAGFSYYDVLLGPMLAAANKAFTQRGKVFHLAMGGEMGGTLVAFPGSYLEATARLRRAWRSPAALRTGLTFFQAYTAGQITRGPGPEAPLNSGSMGAFEGGYGRLLPLDQWPGAARIKAALPDFRALVDTSDFVGASIYARAPADVQPSHIEASSAMLFDELAALGVDLRALLRSNSSKAFIWNEFGLGGGAGACNNVTARDAAGLGAFPWLGVSAAAGYDPAHDPFKAAAGAAYVQAYYAAALAVLRGGAARREPVSAAYIWNCASWDVQGIHTASARWNTGVAQGDWPVRNGFAVASVLQRIRQHNAQVRGGGGGNGRARRRR